MKDILRGAFEELKGGIRHLQDAAARGDMQEVQDGLEECLAAVEAVEETVLTSIGGE